MNSECLLPGQTGLYSCSPSGLAGVESRQFSSEESRRRRECVEPPSAGLRLGCTPFGDDALKLLSAQEVLGYALALVKLW